MSLKAEYALVTRRWRKLVDEFRGAA